MNRLSIFWVLSFEWKLDNPSITPEQVLAMDLKEVIRGVTPEQGFYNLEEIDRLEVVPFRERGRTVIKFQLKE